VYTEQSLQNCDDDTRMHNYIESLVDDSNAVVVVVVRIDH
jgi:hypothetical protein